MKQTNGYRDVRLRPFNRESASNLEVKLGIGKHYRETGRRYQDSRLQPFQGEIQIHGSALDLVCGDKVEE